MNLSFSGFYAFNPKLCKLRFECRKSFTAFASGVVASSSLAGAAATSSLAAGAARTGKVWTGWAGAKTKGVGASMRHTISKMGLGLFKQSVSSSDDIDGGSENKIVEYDSIREGSQVLGLCFHHQTATTQDTLVFLCSIHAVIFSQLVLRYCKLSSPVS